MLLLVHFGKEGAPETLIANISQETLAEMIGTTRSRVSFFMNRFRKWGFIDYHAGDDLKVHSSLRVTLFSTTRTSLRTMRQCSRADIATLGFAISLMTSASVALSRCSFVFLLPMTLDLDRRK